MRAIERAARRLFRSRTRKPVRCSRPRLEELEYRLVPAAFLSIANTTAVEPMPGGTVDMDFTVTCTGDLTSQITVGYTTVAGTAQPNTDFTPTTGTTTIASGSATATIGIPIFNDGVYNNPGLNFSVELTGITNVVGPPVTLAAQQTFATGSIPTFRDRGGLERRWQARPDRRELSLEHGVGAAEHNGARGNHPLLRRPADLRHRD